jgi:hypothetical protein
VPGWGEAVKPYREEAYFWHQVWTSYGRPLNTDIHNMMKRTKNEYHYEYKKGCKAEEKIKSNKLLDACLNGGVDLFKEIKTMRKSKPFVATSMDGVKTNVKGHFKNKYEELYNSADDKLALLTVQKETEDKVDEKSLIDVNKVTPEIVREAAHKLKSGKSDPVFSFYSDCLKNGTKSLYENLSIILQSFLIHGHLTILLLLATLVPIIKDKLCAHGLCWRQWTGTSRMAQRCSPVPWT